MSRCPVVCVWPDGENFRVTQSDADVIVADDLGEWDGRKTVRMKPIDRSGGRLSLRVGARLAVAIQRNQPWAHAALADMGGK
jgi:hypothetical protein